MRLTARVDYALRAMCALASAQAGESGGYLTSEAVAAAEGVPQRFLESIFRELRRAELVTSKRGPDGGHALARSAAAVSIADVIRAVDGPLALVRNLRPEELHYTGASRHLADVWVTLRARERRLLEGTSLADVVAGAVGRSGGPQGPDGDR